jgi:oligoribonuclease
LESGLTERVLKSTLSAADVEEEVLEYIKKHVVEGEGYLAGNSVHVDKEFMKIEFPRVIKHLHYRLVGISRSVTS